MENPEKTIGGSALRVGFLVSFGLLTVLFLSNRAGVQAAELKRGVLNVGFTKSCFLGVNRNDAEAAFKAFLATVGRRRGYDLQSRVEIYEDSPSFEAAIKRKEIHLAIFDSWQYLSMDIRQVMEPYFLPVPKDRIGRKYVVLTRRGSGLNVLSDLKGKELTRLEMGAATMGGPWLETLLLANGHAPENRFFGRVEVVGKPASAVLPVFFGKKHACLLDVEGFEVMKELNPQLGSTLQVVAASEPCVDNVMCLVKDGWLSEAHKTDAIQALAELHLEPAGQQILTLFKVARLIPFEEGHLETVKKLRATHSELRKRAGL